jgi:hypothetical protein
MNSKEWIPIGWQELIYVIISMIPMNIRLASFRRPTHINSARFPVTFGNR